MLVCPKRQKIMLILKGKAFICLGYFFNIEDSRNNCIDVIVREVYFTFFFFFDKRKRILKMFSDMNSGLETAGYLTLVTTTTT